MPAGRVYEPTDRTRADFAATEPLNIDDLQAHCAHAATRAQRFGQRHRSVLAGLAALVMGGFGITAVATVAIAPLVPEPALLPKRLIIESLPTAGLPTQLDALAAQPLTLTRSDITRSTDSPETLLARMGVADAAAASFLRHDPVARQVMAGRGGKMVQARMASDGSLEELVARFPADVDGAIPQFTRLTMRRAGTQWTARAQTAPYGAQVRLASGTVRTNLYAATDESGIPDVIAAQLAEIFSAEIDFHRELRKGDTFHLLYESLTVDGEPVAWNEGVGRVLAAVFVNGSSRYEAVWFAGTDGRGGYYTPDGRSLRRTFLASPLAFSRMTSGFAMRFHPLLHQMRRHNGVDYGAPTGTPVRCVADGTVDFAGRQNGYGNVVIVRHGNGKSTVYAHLSRIDVRRGQRIEQGQRLGAVGATGWATGPHLHFEFRINGVYQNPQRMARSAETVALDPRSRPLFDETVQSVQARLDVAGTLVGRPVSFE